MFRHHTPYRVGVFVIFSLLPLWGAQEDSVYTHSVRQPDFLARYIAVPLPDARMTGLNLVGWVDSLRADTAAIPEEVSADTAVSPTDAAGRPPVLTITQEKASDVLRRGGHLLPVTVPGLNRWSEIDSTGKQITFYEDHEGSLVKVPSTVPLAWYIQEQEADQFQALAQKKLAGALQSTSAQQARRGRTIELLGTDIAGQRVSLRVSGNVAINGGILYKDQSKSFTNFRANKQWDLDVNQKQRFDIEGTIGDRISVLVHQDSENDFEWENDMKIEYQGEEDEILQRIEAGNISLSLPGTQFATGGGGKSSGLFGFKTQSKLGPVDITTVASIERSVKSSKSSTLAQEYTVSDMHYIANRYFFLDMEFRARYYPLTKGDPSLPDGLHTVDVNRVVTRLEVYRSSREAAATYHGKAYVDPDDPEFESSYARETNFERLVLNEDYFFNPNLGWIRLRSPASEYEIIAVAYAIGDTSLAETDTVGDVDYDPNDTTGVNLLNLKLIKDTGQTASHPTWPLEFKNVYSLGGVNISPEGFEVKIFYREGTTENDDRYKGESYLTIFGLDMQNANEQNIPDELVDVTNPNLVNLVWGELHFPALLPFAYSDVPGLATDHEATEQAYDYVLEDPNQNFEFEPDVEDFDGDEKWDVPAIYYTKNQNKKNEESRFEISVKQSSRGASEYHLGFNLVEGSETVFVNGSPLSRDQDYRIDYFTGTLTILDLGKYGADPEITIDYEENVLISFDKKVMLGTRAEMDLGENSFLGVTGLYYNQSIVDERIDIGSEPVRNMLWDVNGRIARDVPLLTRLVDRLPLVETDAASRFRLEGEIAQVLPNPNPLGQAFVDDFEAAKRTTSPSLQYRAWRPASVPVGKHMGDRRKLAWWNPYVDVNVKDIWPQRQTSVRARNLTTTVLVLNALFEEGNNGTINDSLWAGITYPLLASDYDQTLSKFFEIWIKGTEGRMHIDIGSISEDINGDERINTEDRPDGGFTEGNGLLEEREDVGLDGCPDEFEDGMGGCVSGDFDGDGTISRDEAERANDDRYRADGDDFIDEDTEDIARQILAGDYDGIYDGPRVTWANQDDPNGDNFYNTQAPSPDNGRNDNINGTEGNSKIQEGSYPDTEDLDGLGGLFPDDQNAYFTSSFLLDPSQTDPSVVGGETRYDNGNPTGWRLFRIPLSDFVQVGEGTTSWDNVRHLRVWIDSVDGSQSLNGLNARIQIAKIEFVGNEWEELGVAPLRSNAFEKDTLEVGMAVTVANTEDNADYIPPGGVEGEYDRLNDIRLREQSLVLDFSRGGIPPESKAAVKKSIPKQTGTFLVYGSMDMYVYAEGNLITENEDDSSAVFWLRLGQGEDHYYEVRKNVYSGGPDPEHRGWDDRNHISLQLDKLAGLKDTSRVLPDNTVIIDEGTDKQATIKVYELEDMEVYIQGEPSLERIDRYLAGVINMHPDSTLRGRIMMDELRLTNVNREPGMAMRLSGAVNFADLVSTSFNYARRDAEFHTIQQRITRNAVTNENWQANVTVNPHQFLPKSWGIRLPLNVNYSQAVSSPKYLPGKDILAGDLHEAPEDIQRRTQQLGLKASYDKSARSKSWLVRQTLDRFRGSLAFSRKRESTELILSNEARAITGQVGYPIKFSEENYIQPFKILGFIPLLGERIKDTRLYYSPSNLDLAANLNEAITNRTTRADPDSVLETYNFNMARSIKSKYRLTDRINADYGRDANFVLDEYRYDKTEILKSWNPGLRRQFSEQFTFNYSPELITWFQPKLMYQTRYNWTKNAPLDSLKRGAKISTQGRFSGNVTVKLTDLVEVFYTPESRAGPARTRRGRGRRTQTGDAQQGDGKKPLEVANPQIKAVLKTLHTLVGKVSPIAFNYVYSRRGAEPAAIGQPDYNYRLALATDSQLPADVERTGGLNQLTEGEDRDISVRSGLTLSRSISLNFSHARKWSRSSSQSARTTTRSEDFLVLGDTKKVGIPFVNWNIRWSNLEKLPLLNKIPWRVNLDHSYSGLHTKSIQNERLPVEKYNRQFQPLIGLTINFTSGVSATIRTSHTLALDAFDNGRSKTVGQQITASLGYQHRGGITIPLPFLKDLNLRNTVNLNLDFDYRRDRREEMKSEATKYTTMSWSKTWWVTPRITYTFTEKVTGGFNIRYGESDHSVTGRRIDRDFKFDVNIAIRGT
ncbi:MAG: cell surface protein SprA [Fidelibacterota bacterium]|nr:MAG: cell surface protein SprA [Candidatus Neomarinimicrobiota bacterium]